MRDTSDLRLRQRARASMLVRADEAVRARRAFRSNWWLEIAALASITFAMLAFLGEVGSFVKFGLQPPQPPTIFSPQLYVSAYDLVAGRIPLVVAVPAAVVALEFNREMMNALKSDAPAGSMRQWAVTSQRRFLLSVAASVVSMVSVLLGVAVWANVGSGQDVAAAIFTSALAVLAVFFGTMARNYSDSDDVDRAITFDAVKATIGRLDAWENALTQRNVPRPLTLGPTDTQCAGQRRRCLDACRIRVAVAGLMAMVYLGVVLIVVGIMHGGIRVHPLQSAAFALLLLLMQVVMAVLCVVGVGYESLNHWTRLGASKRPRRRLVIKSLVRYATYGLLGATLAAPAVASGEVGPIAIIGGWVLFPGLLWGLAWASRRWPSTRWLQTATWPLWGLVQLSLHRARVAQQTEYERLEAEEAAALHSRRKFIGRFHRVWSKVRLVQAPRASVSPCGGRFN